MAFDVEIRFPVDGRLNASGNIKYSGRLPDTGNPLEDALYEFAKPTSYLNGSLIQDPISTLCWQGVTAPGEGDTFVSNCGWFTVGTRQNKETGLIEPWGYSAPGGVPVTFEEGYSYSSLLFYFESIGVNELAGTLGKFNYVDDKGTTYVFRMDVSNAAAVGNTAAASDAVVNLPGRLRVRYLLAEQTDNAKVKRRIPIGAGGNTNYINGGTITLETVQGNKTFRITGRVGERFSF